MEKQEKTDLPETLASELKTEEILIDEPEKEMIKKFKAGIGHMFVFYFNINDYVRAGDEFLARRDYLTKFFSQRKFIISYNISSGIEFTKGKEKEFREITGFKEQKNPLASVMGANSVGLPKRGSSALLLLENFLKKVKDSVLVIEYAEKLCPSGNGTTLSEEDRVNTVTLLRWAQDLEIMANSNMIILLTSLLSDLNSDLRVQDSGIEAICVPKPDVEERGKYVSCLGKEYPDELKDLNIPQIANFTAGLSRKQIEDIFLEVHQEKTGLSLELIKKKKEEIFNNEYRDVLKIVEPKHGMETIGGLEKAKNEFAKIIQAIKTGNYRRVPMGILIFGPPGTGKTVFAEAVAKQAEFNFVHLGNIRYMFVGSSEQRREKAELGIRSLTPVVVFVDEVDQMFGRRDEISTDSGVGRRLMGDWLKFMSDTSLRGKVLWFGASNRPDLMETAMKRPGRLGDLKIPFLMPQSAEERAKIFKAILIKYEFESKIKDLKGLAESLEDYSGADADIEAIVLIAFRHAQDKNREVLSKEDFEYGIDDYIPARDEEMYDFMTLEAIKECSSRSFLPENAKEIVDKIKQKYAGNLPKSNQTVYKRRVRTEN